MNEINNVTRRLDSPVLTKQTIIDMEDMPLFTHALIFDDLLIVTQKETNCFVLKSSKGLIVIDAIWPSVKTYEAIIGAIKEVGWNPDSLYKLILTHGHVDHTGCGKWLVNNHNVKTYMSRIDDIYWREHPTKPDRPETWKNYNIDVYLNDKDIILCGNKKIFVYSTPGHTPGCLSFIFPVKDNDIHHMAALFGGATPPRTKPDIQTYLHSLDYFMKEADEKNVDVALSNHTAIDNGLLRIAYSKVRYSYMPNIYIVGYEGFEKYSQVFKTLSNNMLGDL
ncbi:MBL fold metallo-hydrolase [Aminipila butyrica]|uniref:MBL fold metallo-hydrolase n=1 Tax=Aminipila butyrica TaxID=433296 RepID=A0A858BUC3_9FIRM|nr:MBL fold metallo-hydrolase [Aminipila butyrica]QIB68675.1 MBL fold metallo-hydrolase [Aminipila butyrica]